MRIYPIVIKELKQLARDPRTLLMVVLMPLTVMTLFGLGYGGRTGALPIAVANLDEGSLGWDFIEAIKGSEELKIKCYLNTADEAIDMIVDGEVYGAIIIPEDFTENLVRGRTAYIRIITDETNPNAENVITGATVASAYYFQIQILKKLGSPSIELCHETVRGPTVSRMEAFTPITMSLLLHLVPMQLIAMSVCKEREKGTYERLIMSPVSRWDIISGKLAAYFIATLADMAVTLSVAIIGFKVRVKCPLQDIIIFSMLFLICSLSMGLLVSVLSKNQLQAIGTSLFLFVPSMILSGMFIPVELVSKSVRWISYTLPLYYFFRGYRKLMIGGHPIIDVAYECFSLIVMTIIFFITAISMLKMKVE